MDGTARRVITLGGVVIIASILAMLVFLVAETIPLWGRTRANSLDARSCSLVGGTGPVPILRTNEYREILFAITSDGKAQVTRVDDGTVLLEESLAGIGGGRISAASPVDAALSSWVAGTDDGRLLGADLEDGVEFIAGGRRYRPEIATWGPLPARSGSRVEAIAGAAIGGGIVVVAVSSDRAVTVFRREQRRTLFGETAARDTTWSLAVPPGLQPTAVALEAGAARLYVGTAQGQILEWAVDPGATETLGSYEALPGSAVTVLGTLLGGNSVVIGGAEGEVEVWFQARSGDDGEELRFIRGHRFQPHDTAVAGMTPSSRDKGFVTWDRQGRAAIRYATTSATRLWLPFADLYPDGPRASAASLHIALAPKGDALVVSGSGPMVRILDLVNPHPEVSGKALFGRVHYEGYAGPEYVWQSTGATDETEPKLSLVPLIFGTLKGTFYALIVSVPIAILAAVYTALFMRPGLRNVVKPAMELMAAMPSVVLGLLAGLWLAPRLQAVMPAALAVPVIAPAIVVAAGFALRRIPGPAGAWSRPGREAIVMIPVLVVAVAMILGANGVVDRLFPGGFLDWVYRDLDIRYDQRNALVVGLAMGLAVIPIIFSISEDALSSVPRHLTAGSLAVGASPWQTAWRVVLPAASPGIFSAIMIGFGRAVGETMIVLMATGNTPIMDFSAFNGFRTLSANIAVEIAEAPHGGSLYRVLFLAALLLFVITFAVNTAAEIVRQRLRHRYSRF